MKYFLLLIVCLWGCSDDPGEVGKGLLSVNDFLKIDSLTITAIRDTTFRARITGVASTMVGEFQDIEARAVIGYSGFNSVPATATVDSAILNVVTRYKFQDSTGTVGFEVHEMNITWSESTIGWDTLQAAGTYQSVIQGGTVKNISPGDTSIQVRIDSLVRRWVQTGVNAPNGILLIPSTFSSTIIVGSNSSSVLENRPSITVYYHDAADTTIKLLLYSSQRAFVGNSNQPLAAGTIFTQSGVSYRSRVEFDSLKLPAKASISSAIVEFSLANSSSLFNQSSRDSIVVHLLRKNYSPFDSLAFATICSPGLNGAQKVYRATITPIVQEWITREPNYGLVVRSYGEFLNFDRFALYGSAAAAALRPKLIVTYTVFH